ncbi:unnamed protein product [Nezara viridula]|uniref:Neuropeptide n=1 Tax=Nezara viridula TaxID=85310 RepID=A0A9P0H9Y8_NEZVI|nr:unnamed protein product [Nezara viridula]
MMLFMVLQGVLMFVCQSVVDSRGPHHPHGSPHYRPTPGSPKITMDADLLHDTGHIQEDLGKSANIEDLNKLSPEELEFQYFKHEDTTEAADKEPGNHAPPTPSDFKSSPSTHEGNIFQNPNPNIQHRLPAQISPHSSTKCQSYVDFFRGRNMSTSSQDEVIIKAIEQRQSLKDDFFLIKKMDINLMGRFVIVSRNIVENKREKK